MEAQRGRRKGLLARAARQISSPHLGPYSKRSHLVTSKDEDTADEEEPIEIRRINYEHEKKEKEDEEEEERLAFCKFPAQVWQEASTCCAFQFEGFQNRQ